MYLIVLYLDSYNTQIWHSILVLFTNTDVLKRMNRPCDTVQTLDG